VAREPIYLTRNGLEKIKEELRYLKEVRRQEIADYMGAAIADGDIRESAAYDDARQQQSANEARLADLEELVARAVVVEHAEGAEAIAQLGANLELRSTDGESLFLALVGTHEADMLENKISDESPLGKALLGKRMGDSVDWNSGTYQVMSISYD
jgi:transcription elongation factor GreA